MKNRVLKRQLKKFLQIQGEENFAEIITFMNDVKKNNSIVPPVVSDFIEGLPSFVEALDHGFNEYDRVLRAREVSIEINETELNRVYASLKGEFLIRDQALEKLRIILTSMDSSTAFSGSNDLSSLLAKVEILVEDHLVRSRDLEFVFKESLKLSRSRDFSELGYLLRDCAKSLVDKKVNVQLFFNVQMLQLKQNASGFALLSDSQGIHFENLLTPDEVSQLRGNSINIQYEADDQPTIIILFSSIDQSREWTASPSAMQTLKALTSSILSASENIHHNQQEKVKQRMELELKTARLIQQTLVPRDLLVVDNQLRLASWYQTSSECGGDWWGNYKLKDGRHVIFIGDVTGHGMASALFTAVVKGFCDSLPARENFEFGNFFVELNNHVFSSETSEKSMSMLGISYNPKNRNLEIVPAGHLMPFLIQANGSGTQVKISEPSIRPSPLLGLNDKQLVAEDFERFTVKVNPGDKLLLFTDGLTEAHSPAGIEFSESRLRRLLFSLHPQIDAVTLRDQIRKQSEAFRHEAPLLDDISMVIAEFL